LIIDNRILIDETPELWLNHNFDICFWYGKSHIFDVKERSFFK